MPLQLSVAPSRVMRTYGAEAVIRSIIAGARIPLQPFHQPSEASGVSAREFIQAAPEHLLDQIFGSRCLPGGFDVFQRLVP